MTLDQFFTSSYAWADANADLVLLLAVLIPVLGTLGAAWGKGGRTDADGRFIASAVMAVAVIAVVLEVIFLFIARAQYGASILHTNLLLLVAPLVCLGGAVWGIRRVFPLSELGSMRTVADLGLLLAILAGIVWLFSRFRGWGIYFIGTFTQLLVVSAVGVFFVWRLWRRVFGGTVRPQA